MIKMPCLFVREFHGHNKFTITEAVTPGCEWVLAGEGTASRKRDGTACAFIGTQLYKRYDAKKDRKTGEYKLPPEGSIPCSEPDPVTGHWPHWTLIGPHDYWHAEAFARQAAELVDGATYELCGPKFQGNPERLTEHTLIRHGAEVLFGPVSSQALGHAQRAEPESRITITNVLSDGTVVPLNFEGLRRYLTASPFEGIVFAHPDGRFAKIRRNDFGLSWPVAEGER